MVRHPTGRFFGAGLVVATVLPCHVEARPAPLSAPFAIQAKAEGKTAIFGAAGADRKAGRKERRLNAERPTVDKRQAEDAQAEQQSRISLQIPERLRKPLQAKIEARITRNIQASRELREDAIGLLRKFVAEADPKSPDMPEALMRLAELEWERSREEFLAKFRDWERTPADERSGSPPEPNYAVSRKRLLAILRKHKSYRDYDLALYVDGFLAQEEGKAKKSLDRFNLILAWFPKSRFVPDAHMVRAEYEFTKAEPDYTVALAEYEKVLSFPNTELRDLARFKSAWTLWRLGRKEEAAKRFLTVFQDTAEAEARTGGRRAEIDELQREALRNLVTVFAEDEQNTAEDMHRFLVDAGGEKFADRIVLALAETFYEQAHYERGIEAYRLLLKLKPTDPKAYRYALKVAQGHSTIEAWPRLEQDYRWITKTYAAIDQGSAPDSSPSASGASAWAVTQTPEVKKEAAQAVERQLREDAVGLHAKAQNDDSRSEFEAAEKLYAVYLEHFSTAPEAYDMFFNAGEIDFYHLDDAVGAADNYLAAVRLEPQGELSRDALYNALTALEVARASEFELAKKEGKRAKETPTDKKLTEAMELYIATYPDDAKVVDLLFRQGKLYYDYEVYDPAVRQFGLLLEKYPRSQRAKAAGELILDSFNKSEDYKNIEDWARRLKEAPAFQGDAEQGKLNALIVGAVFKQGEQLAAGGKHGEAASAYLRAASEFPKEPQAARAAVNAEVEAKRAGDLTTLSAAAALLSEKHGARKEVPEGLWIAATTYQGIGLFGEAAGYHEQIAARFRKSEHHKDAAFNAVVLRTAIGDHDEAISAGEAFKRQYPRDPLADEATFLMGKSHEKAEKKEAAEKLYLKYANTAKSNSRRVEAWVRLALVRDDDPTGRSRALDQAMKIYKYNKSRLDKKGRYFAAQARYMQGESFLRKFDEVTIEGDPNQLKQRLRKKSQLLKEAAETFLDASQMGVAEWTTASLYQIGRTYESFAKALLDSPAPSNLNPEQAEQYTITIEEFVIPIEERSIEAYESGWLKAVELGIFNEWTAKMREALGRLNAELYPPLEEVGFSVRSEGALALPPLIAGPRRGAEGTKYLMPVAGKKESPDEKLTDGAVNDSEAASVSAKGKDGEP